ncbi:MAG: hypothetical protein FD167_404 [bacterium]|nr:MAG: hypothetical protein FD167_404 [bacterium]
MSDEVEIVRLSMIDALQQATIGRRLDWIRTNPDEVDWKPGTIEQRYAMISEEGIFVTFTRMRSGAMELLVQFQEEGCYREYQISEEDGEETKKALDTLYNLLPSTGKMIQDFRLITQHLQPHLHKEEHKVETEP